MDLHDIYSRILNPSAAPQQSATQRTCAQLWLRRCDLTRDYYEAAAAGQLPHTLAAIEQEIQDVSDELVRREAAGRTPFTFTP